MQERIDERKRRAVDKDWERLLWLLFALAVEGLFIIVGIWALVLS